MSRVPAMGLRPMILVAVLTAGCGTQDRTRSADDPATVSSVVQQMLTVNDAHVRCSTLVSRRFIREVYESPARCLTVEADGTAREYPGGHASDTRVAGDGATVRITRASGRSGIMHLSREGGRWKVDHYDDDLLRAIFTDYLVHQVVLTASRPGLNGAAVPRCVSERITAIGPARFRRFADAVLGNREEAAAVLKDVIVRCLSDPRSGSGGRSYLRVQLEASVVARARNLGYDAQRIGCLRSGLRSVTDSEIRQQAASDKTAPHVVAIINSCQ